MLALQSMSSKLLWHGPGKIRNLLLALMWRCGSSLTGMAKWFTLLNLRAGDGLNTTSSLFCTSIECRISILNGIQSCHFVGRAARMMVTLMPTHGMDNVRSTVWRGRLWITLLIGVNYNQPINWQLAFWTQFSDNIRRLQCLSHAQPPSSSTRLERIIGKIVPEIKWKFCIIWIPPYGCHFNALFLSVQIYY